MGLRSYEQAWRTFCVRERSERQAPQKELKRQAAKGGFTMKIHIMIAGAFLGLLAYAFYINAENARLQETNTQIQLANLELNATITKIIKANALEKEFLQQKYEVDLQNLKKIERAKSYVKNSTEKNVTRLFNDTILRLQ